MTYIFSRGALIPLLLCVLLTSLVTAETVRISSKPTPFGKTSGQASFFHNSEELWRGTSEHHHKYVLIPVDGYPWQITDDGIICGDNYISGTGTIYFRQKLFKESEEREVTNLPIVHMNSNGDIVGSTSSGETSFIWKLGENPIPLSPYLSFNFIAEQKQQHTEPENSFDIQRQYAEHSGIAQFITDNELIYGIALNGHFIVRYSYFDTSQNSLLLDLNFSHYTKDWNGIVWQDGIPVLLGENHPFDKKIINEENCFFFENVTAFLEPYRLARPFEVGNFDNDSYYLIKPKDFDEVIFEGHGVFNGHYKTPLAAKGNYIATRTAGTIDNGVYLNEIKLLTKQGNPYDDNYIILNDIGWAIYDDHLRRSDGAQLPLPKIIPRAMNSRKTHIRRTVNGSHQWTEEHSPQAVGQYTRLAEYMSTPMMASIGVLIEQNPITLEYETYDLNNLVALPAGWRIERATDINNHGAITVFLVNPSTGQSKGGVLLPIGMKVTNRDDPTKKWADATDHNANIPIYAGESTGDMVSWKLAGTDNWTNVMLTWTAEGPSEETIAGPSGLGKNEWTINNDDEETVTKWLKWKPGEWTIKVQIGSSQVEFKQEVGVRSDNIVVIGWIDPAQVTLNNNEVQSALIEVLPIGGFSLEDGDNSKLKAGILIKHIAEEGVLSPFQVDEPWYAPPIMIGVEFLAFSEKDKAYALNWMFKHAGNSTPPNDFTDDEGYFSQTKLDDFSVTQDKTLYKLINHYQIKYLVDKDKKFKSKSILHLNNKVYIGDTKDPARIYDTWGIFDWLGRWWENYPDNGAFPGMAREHNSDNAIVTDTTTQLHNEGTPDQKALDAFKNLTGHDQGYIWSSITFFSDLQHYSETISSLTGKSLTRNPKPTEFYEGKINTQVYPTYWIYINGQKIDVQNQAPNPSALFPNTDKCQ